jgi:hypothetical protein
MLLFCYSWGWASPSPVHLGFNNLLTLDLEVDFDIQFYSSLILYPLNLLWPKCIYLIGTGLFVIHTRISTSIVNDQNFISSSSNITNILLFYISDELFLFKRFKTKYGYQQQQNVKKIYSNVFVLYSYFLFQTTNIVWWYLKWKVFLSDIDHLSKVKATRQSNFNHKPMLKK